MRQSYYKHKLRNQLNMAIFILLSLALAAAAWVAYSRQRLGRNKFPPGPPPLPIVGSIFKLGVNPHKSLGQLAKTYGPLMSIQLGNQLAVIISSPEMAREILQKHGYAFSNRATIAAFSVLGHADVSLVMAPSDSDVWKKFRRIGKEELFSNHALQSSQHLRQERLQKLVDHVSMHSREGRAMNVGEATFTTMTNLITATMFSTELVSYGDVSGSGASSYREHVNAITKYMGIPNVADFFPILAPFDPQGLGRKITYHLGKLLEIVESVIEKRMQARKASSTYEKKNDFLETILDLMEGNEYELNINEIKHLCVDLILASNTTGASAEWTMVELLLHPEVLAKVKAELKIVVGEKTLVEDSDISRLPYLQAVIKEAFRYHTIAPILNPLEAREDTQVNGYTIPKYAKIIVNFWAITRDPTTWKDPENFDPERFLDNEIDYKGRDFELIPFGSGRRICPGMPLASSMLHCMVATLCHNFDWKLEAGSESKTFQRESVFGLEMQKKFPLMAIPIKV